MYVADNLSSIVFLFCIDYVADSTMHTYNYWFCISASLDSNAL